MRKIFLPLVLLFGLALQMMAQQAKDIMKEPIPVAMFQATYAFQLPAFDTRTSFGVNHTVGASFVYKTESNWIFTANGNYIFGNKVKGNRTEIYGEGITTTDGEITGGEGPYVLLNINERGMHFQGEVGKLFPMAPNPNSGIFVQGGLGYLFNRIRTDYSQDMYNTPYVLDEDYEYGYDRMRGGPAFHLEAGYLYLGNARVANFSVSIEMTYARTRDLRKYDFRVFDGVPVGYTDPHKRYNDFYYGIRLSWNIPTYQRQPEEFYYN